MYFNGSEPNNWTNEVIAAEQDEKPMWNGSNFMVSNKSGVGNDLTAGDGAKGEEAVGVLWWFVSNILKGGMYD